MLEGYDSTGARGAGRIQAFTLILRIKHMKKLTVPALTIAIALSGCATRSKDISPAYVSPVQYQSFTCRQIAEEAGRLSSRAIAASNTQDQKANKDAAGMAIGIFILWPMLLFNEGDGAEAAEVARLKGEMQALEQASIQKNCRIKFETPAPKAEPAKKTSAKEK